MTMEAPPPKTKIICTIGPKTKSPEMLADLMKHGMNIVRMNFSHGDHAYHGSVIANMRSVMEETRRICGLMLDTKGPEIRTCSLKESGGEVKLKANAKFVLTTDQSHLGDENMVAVTYANLPSVLRVGNSVLLDDGLIELRVDEIDVNKGLVVCTVQNNGVLGEKKGVNLPNVVVDLPAITEKDRADIKFGIENKVDFIAASFIRKAADVHAIRQILREHKSKHRSMSLVGPMSSLSPSAMATAASRAASIGHASRIKIISKIENREGLDNFDEILAASDGIMVARGDLGVEIPIEQVSIAQKMMIQKCNAAGKFVITATQMLESMTSAPSPTRAEASDVANAVLDGTDCVMLSGETAKGSYPVEAVTMMRDICLEAEATDEYQQHSRKAYSKLAALLTVSAHAGQRALHHGNAARSNPVPASVSALPPLGQEQSMVAEAIAVAAVKACEELDASLMLCLTESGNTARLASKYRPSCPILAVTAYEQTAQQLMVSRSVLPLLVGSMVGSSSLISRAIDAAKQMGMCCAGDAVVVMSGQASHEGQSGGTNAMRVVLVDDPLYL